MSYDLLTYFFKHKTNLLEQLSDRELFALREIYRGTPMTKILREPQGIPPFPPRRRDQRFLVSCPAMMECEDGDEECDDSDEVTVFGMTGEGIEDVVKGALKNLKVKLNGKNVQIDDLATLLPPQLAAG